MYFRIGNEVYHIWKREVHIRKYTGLYMVVFHAVYLITCYVSQIIHDEKHCSASFSLQEKLFDQRKPTCRIIAILHSLQSFFYLTPFSDYMN